MVAIKPQAHLCYNVYVTLSIVVYNIAHNYWGMTTLQLRYYTVRCYHISLTFQKLGRDTMAENASNGAI